MALRHKGVLLILDGLGDRPIPSLGGQTPLEAASTPTLDRLALEGSCGLVDPLSPGVPVDTATGTGLLLGAPPSEIENLARGPIEAIGAGLEIAPGDVALRCNFATLASNADGLRIEDRRAGRIRTGTEELAESLRGVNLGDGITATLKPATQHRAVLRLSGQGLSASISDTDPGVVALPTRVLRSKARHRGDLRASRTASAVNAFVREAHERLREHPVNQRRISDGEPPANGVLTRGAGLATPVRSIIEQLGLSATVIAGESTVIGLAGLFEMAAHSDSRFTGLPDTDIEAKVEAAVSSLASNDLVFLHIKGADICSHDGNPDGKRDFLTRVDEGLAPLRETGAVIGVTGDHSSDCSTGNHSGDPVPAILYTPGGRVDSVEEFGETTCATGGLGRITATEYLVSLLDAMGAVVEWRPGDAHYDTGHHPPF